MTILISAVTIYEALQWTVIGSYGVVVVVVMFVTILATLGKMRGPVSAVVSLVSCLGVTGLVSWLIKHPVEEHPAYIGPWDASIDWNHDWIRKASKGNVLPDPNLQFLSEGEVGIYPVRGGGAGAFGGLLTRRGNVPLADIAARLDVVKGDLLKIKEFSLKSVAIQPFSDNWDEVEKNFRYQATVERWGPPVIATLWGWDGATNQSVVAGMLTLSKR